MDKQVLERIKKQLSVLEEKIPDYDTVTLDISFWSVGDHLEHLFRAHLRILERIESHMHDNPEKGKKLTLIGRLVLLFGRIPRGVGKAPSLAEPKGCTESKLREYLKQMNDSVERLQQRIPELNDSLYAFPHPVFGLFKVHQWLRFIEVHTRHHLRIIEAIQISLT